ncbi:MAG: methyltransferase domain-containing protein [Leptolyngbyaceae cyanobacterium SM1_3_5]|nr:methyltransferase domain-containing protein [Leptolyngbyaceae cyanobacterium SM1_3_5]
MTTYDAIGNNYAQTRKSDPRIATALLEILKCSPASSVIDVGAGTGSYAIVLAEHGYRVLAIEPSAIMRNQAIPHAAIEWFAAFAESLPLANQSADAAIIMLAFHHCQDHQQALREIYRVVGDGQIVLFTYDPEKISEFWLTHYFPSLVADVRSTFLSIEKLKFEIKSITGAGAEVIPFPLPHNLTDSFAAVGWARPELYLDSAIRNGISSFSKFDLTELENGLFRLEEDLKTGEWNQQYGHLRQQQKYDVGYRFVFTAA